MITIHELPALRLLLSLVIGILCAPLIDLSDPVIQVNLIGLILMIFAIFFFLRTKFHLRFIGSIVQMLTGIFVTMLFLTLTDPVKSPFHITSSGIINDSTKVEFFATCTDPVSHKNSYQIPLEITAVRTSQKSRYRPVNGKLLLFAKELTYIPRPGDQLKFSATLKKPEPAANPNAFDYSLYLKRQGIYKTGFIKSEDLVLIKKSSFWNIKNLTLKLRDWLLDRTKLLIGDNEISDVSAGLLFGYRDKIDAETEQQFVNSGAVHLLAVSGMHVILIFTNIRWMLRLLRINRVLSEKWVSLIAIIMIWMFSFLVGLAASIVRATIMLSLLIGGDIIRKHGNSLNIVCAGAIIMLIYDPMTLWDVGFQLSFAAVIGIIQLQQPIRNILPSRLHKSKTIVDLISVTCAAQIGTLPLILFYFHQFPVYFLITGVVAVVISDWIIKIGFALLIVSAFYLPLAEYFALAWYWAGGALIKSIELINKLPNVLIDRIYFDLPMALITSAGIILVIIHQTKKIKYFKKIIVSCCLLLLLLDFKSLWVNQDVERVTVYRNKKSRIVEIQNGLNSLTIVDDGIDKKGLNNVILGNQLVNNVKESKVVKVKNDERLIFSFGNEKYDIPSK